MAVDYGTRSYRPRQQEPPPTTTTGTIPGESGGGGEGGLSSALDEILAGLGAGTGGVRQPLGVGAGYAAMVPRQTVGGLHYYPHGYSYSRGGWAPGSAPTDPVAVPARYYTDDEYTPANYSSNVITDIQRQLAYVGLFDANVAVVPGDWGEETASAFRRLLAYANQHGMSWQTALNHLKAQTDGIPAVAAAGGRMKIDEFGNLVPLDGGAARQPLVTRTTDPRTVEIVLREASMNLLGQALSPDQVGMMREAYNQMEIQRQQEAYDKQLTGGSVIDIPSVESFAQAEIEAQHPEEAQEYRGLTYLNEAMNMLASPAWGLSRG